MTIKIAPMKALSVMMDSSRQLKTVKKGKGESKFLTFTDHVYVLPKLDGVYAIKSGGMLRTRTMAPYRKELQERFSSVPEGVCGELIVGPRLASDSWAVSVSDVNKKTGKSEAILHMFDIAVEGPFYRRHGQISRLAIDHCIPIEANMSIGVTKGFASSDPEIFKLMPDENETIEGIILRPVSMAYTATRASHVRPFFMRIKGEETVDGAIIDIRERLHNANDAKDTHDGKLRRHSFKNNLERTGLAGSIQVLLPDGRQVVVGTGFSLAQAEDLWTRRNELVGCAVELKRHEHVRETLAGVKSEQGAYVFLRLREDK